MSKKTTRKLSPIDVLHNTPDVLLFGNGLSRNAGGKSTDEIIRKLWSNKNVDESDIKDEQFPIKIIISTEDSVDKACEKISGIMDGYSFYKDKNLSLIKKFMNLNFDTFITTNYSYEAEYALDKYFGNKKSKYAVHTDRIKRREQKYFIHSFYRMPNDTSYCDIWHMHGEAKNKSSLIIGQYYYGNLLHKYIDYVNQQKRFTIKEDDPPLNAYSWLDYFIFGNVYIVGLNLDFSEYDLWWLLNKKKREKYNRGTVYYFKSKKDTLSKSLTEMLRLYDVEVVDDRSGSNPDDENYYDDFYNWVYNYLKNTLEKK